jgi:hypothetical protein
LPKAHSPGITASENRQKTTMACKKRCLSTGNAVKLNVLSGQEMTTELCEKDLDKRAVISTCHGERKAYQEQQSKHAVAGEAVVEYIRRVLVNAVYAPENTARRVESKTVGAL